jgi:hypothetical protein
MALIGEILVAEGHLSPDGLQEALDWQVLYGGRIGTNLLELKLAEEEHLARALGKQMGAEVVWGNIDVDPAVIAVIPKHIADRQEIVPWKMDKRRLKILCAQINVQVLDELSYKIGRTCVPVVAPEFRIFQLLRAHYQATRQMRALDFGVVPEEGRAERKKKKAKESGEIEAAPELIDEAAFNDIYAQVIAGRAKNDEMGPPKPVPAPEPIVTPPQPVAKAPPPVAKAAPPKPASTWSPSKPQAKAAPPMVKQVARLEEKIEALPDDAILEELPESAIIEDAPPAEAEAVENSHDTAEDLAPIQPFHWDDEHHDAPPARDESPLDFKSAMAALAGVSDRDEIAHIVLRAARTKAARAVLLQVQGPVAIGWDGLGEGLENGAARSVAMPLAADSAFSLVVKTRSHYMGPLQKTPGNIRFLATIGKKVPKSSLIFPILHKGRVSHMLYLDNGHHEQAPTDVGEMLILSQRISQTVEELVQRKRKAARG